MWLHFAVLVIRSLMVQPDTYANGGWFSRCDAAATIISSVSGSPLFRWGGTTRCPCHVTARYRDLAELCWLRRETRSLAPYRSNRHDNHLPAIGVPRKGLDISYS